MTTCPLPRPRIQELGWGGTLTGRPRRKKRAGLAKQNSRQSRGKPSEGNCRSSEKAGERKTGEDSPQNRIFEGF
jgi:hypothetical protein